ncbi:MAG: hypothetical protein EOP22_19630 [Hyphomicrobiales bacterium]|nr:MAG: hypothetical protein EOP22_19630 [Hyphomicrobiales bacterium]
MPDKTPSRRSYQRQLNLQRRLADLLAELDELPFREAPLCRAHAGRVRRVLAEAGSALATPLPALSGAVRNPGQIFAAALLHHTSLERQIREQSRSVIRKNMQSYPRPLPVP